MLMYFIIPYNADALMPNDSLVEAPINVGRFLHVYCIGCRVAKNDDNVF